MYSLVTMEDTIRIPAEYIRKDRKLEDHIDELAHAAFEGRFDEDENYTLLTFNHETVGRGKIIHGDGAIYQRVRFKALHFTMDANEVVDGAVEALLLDVFIPQILHHAFIIWMPIPKQNHR